MVHGGIVTVQSATIKLKGLNLNPARTSSRTSNAPVSSHTSRNPLTNAGVGRTKSCPNSYLFRVQCSPVVRVGTNAFAEEDYTMYGNRKGNQHMTAIVLERRDEDGRHISVTSAYCSSHAVDVIPLVMYLARLVAGKNPRRDEGASLFSRILRDPYWTSPMVS